jgi:hypothetical protein
VPHSSGLLRLWRYNNDLKRGKNLGHKGPITLDDPVNPVYIYDIIPIPTIMFRHHTAVQDSAAEFHGD